MRQEELSNDTFYFVKRNGLIGTLDITVVKRQALPTEGNFKKGLRLEVLPTKTLSRRPN